MWFVASLPTYRTQLLNKTRRKNAERNRHKSCAVCHVADSAEFQLAEQPQRVHAQFDGGRIEGLLHHRIFRFHTCTPYFRHLSWWNAFVSHLFGNPNDMHIQLRFVPWSLGIMVDSVCKSPLQYLKRSISSLRVIFHSIMDCSCRRARWRWRALHLGKLWVRT